MLPSAKSPPACCSGRNLSESRPARITCYGMLPDNTRTLVACTEGPLCARSGHRPASGDGSNFQQTLNASSKQSRRVSNGLSQHCIQLRLCELLRRPHYWLARRHNLMNRASAGRQKRGHSLGRRHDLRLCGRPACARASSPCAATWRTRRCGCALGGGRSARHRGHWPRAF
jgi:hypothetical protein